MRFPIRTLVFAGGMMALTTLGLVAASPGQYTYNFETEGRITAFNATAKTFVVNTYTVKVSTTTRYGYEDVSVTSNRFWSVNRKGAWVEVKGNRSGKVVSAVKVELKRDAAYLGDEDAR